MNLIPEEVLWQAYAEAALPLKKITPHSAAIWEAVVNLKAAEKAKHGEAIARERLADLMKSSFAEGAPGFMDELARAWIAADVSVKRKWTIRREGSEQVELADGQVRNSPSSPKTRLIIEVIMKLQRDATRAPTRREILDEVGEICETGLDEAALSRQLTRLGWNDLLS